MRILLGGVLLGVLGFGGFTWWALESGGVAKIETRTAEGSTRVTHIWYAIQDDEVWLEAGTPENGWFLDIAHSPRIVLVVDGESTSYVAEPVRDPSGQARIRSLFRNKYGFRDQWMGLFVDGSRSVAVRLRRPDDSGAADHPDPATTS